MRIIRLAAPVLVALTSHPAVAQAGSGQVGVTVTVPIPASLTRAAVEAGMAKSVPLYERIPGLVRKYFTIGEGTFGGLYLFRDRAAAQAWFSEAWAAKAAATYGARPTVTYFDVPLVVDNSGAK